MHVNIIKIIYIIVQNKIYNEYKLANCNEYKIANFNEHKYN